MDRLKLKWVIFSFLLGFCALLLMLLWLFQTVFLHDMYKAIRTREIQTAIEYVGENINSSSLAGILENLKDEKEIFVTPSSDFVSPDPTALPAPDGRGRPRQESITRTKEFTLSDGRTVSLTFHAMITPVDATVSTIKMQLYLVTGIMVVMAVALAMLIARKISRPLEKISGSAKILAGGDYDVSFDGRGFREIRELSDTLNVTADALSKVEGLRRELLANVSHDLRTPLSLIYSYAEMMHDFPDEITPEQTETIMDETARLASLVGDVLDLSKLENGMETLNGTVFSLTQLVREITLRTAELVSQNGYTIDFEYEGDYLVYGDRVKITQVYYNLLINAINYSGETRDIEVRQSHADHSVRISVTDHGEGITPEELPYIWDRYYKSDKSHKRAETGSGLGLAIVRKILNLHGARHGAESRPGEGSTFWFEMEIAEGESEK